MARLLKWREEAVETAAPPRTLVDHVKTPVAGGRWQQQPALHGERMLHKKLAEYNALVARLQRFALLNAARIHEPSTAGNEITVSRTRYAQVVDQSGAHLSTVLCEVAGLDETRSSFADLVSPILPAMPRSRVERAEIICRTHRGRV